MGGFDQAKIFTNTVEIESGLPRAMMKLANEIEIQNYEEAIQMYEHL